MFLFSSLPSWEAVGVLGLQVNLSLWKRDLREENISGSGYMKEVEKGYT